VVGTFGFESRGEAALRDVLQPLSDALHALCQTVGRQALLLRLLDHVRQNLAGCILRVFEGFIRRLVGAPTKFIACRSQEVVLQVDFGQRARDQAAD
jgi:hypothetical protein